MSSEIEVVRCPRCDAVIALYPKEVVVHVAVIECPFCHYRRRDYNGDKKRAGRLTKVLTSGDESVILPNDDR